MPSFGNAVTRIELYDPVYRGVGLATSVPGTFETCRGSRKMSVKRGRPEVIGEQPKRRD
jgi:hypothetical protein